MSSPVRGLAVGLEASVAVLVTERGAPLTPTQAVGLIERAVAHTIEKHLPADRQSLGQELSLTITDTDALPTGERLQARARVQNVDVRLIELSIEISVGGRSLATARHTRLLVRRGPP